MSEIHEEFGSPENLRGWMLEKGDQDGKGVPQDASFIVNHRMPLEYIKGVWDTDTHPKKPLFESLEEYLDTLYTRFPEKMPQNPSSIDYNPKSHIGKKRVIEEYKKLEEVKQEIQEVERFSDSFWEDIHTELVEIQRKDLSDKTVEFDQIAKNGLHYNKKLENIREDFAKLGHELELGEPITSVTEMYIELPRIIYELDKSRQEINQAIIKEKQAIKDSDWSREKIQDAKQLDEKIEEIISQRLSGIPPLDRDAINIENRSGREILRELRNINPDLSRYFDKDRWKIW